nr:hypothetical protein [Chlorokybus atmophyticus]
MFPYFAKFQGLVELIAFALRLPPASFQLTKWWLQVFHLSFSLHGKQQVVPSFLAYADQNNQKNKIKHLNSNHLNSNE